ncbi:MAG: hypothetical protein LBU51_03140, partial [Bacteroidales bacterium]|nr:hypothetical protein [Bacteroidales bacterium]
MAKTIREIQDDIKIAFISDAELLSKYDLEFAGNVGDEVAFYDDHFSKVSVESIFIYLVSLVARTIYVMFDWIRDDVNYMVEHERYGYTGWYEKMALIFRYGSGISNNYGPTGSDFSENTIYPDEMNADDLAQAQVVKHAFAKEETAGRGVVIKVAGENENGE